jgi:acylphosphatase/tetratricopeptide (TPR) repeat protein
MPGEVTPSLETLLRSLQRAGVDLDVEGLLDSLWLGMHMRPQQPAGADVPPRPIVPPPPDDSPPPPGTSPATTPQRPPFGSQREGATRGGRAVSRTAGVSARSVAARDTLTLAAASALPESRALLKALRPLRRRVPSPGAGVLDIDETVRRAAEEDLWVPTYAPARERWLDVLLVADHGLAMVVWKDTIDEFERVLRTSGAFRSVRSWWLESDQKVPTVRVRGRGTNPARPEGLVKLTRGVGRSVVLVISDCVGARWHDGTIPLLLGAWSRSLPVALTQVTPEWFWARTALGDTVPSEFRSAIPVAVNHRFRWDATSVRAAGVSTQESKTLLRVPAVTLTSSAVTRLAGLIAGVGREWAPGVVFDLTWTSEEEEGDGRKLSAGERVARFRALASKGALRLAAVFAASPVRTLGVLRLLRRDLIPDAGPFAEAEVILGGIVRVRREHARWDLGASLPLEFMPDVQPLLLDGAFAADVLRVLAHAARVAQSGVGPTFTSWLENPSAGAAQLDPKENDFAAAAAQVLGRLGGAYAQIVKSGSATTVETTTESAAASEPQEASIGRPHPLPLPETLVGRDSLLEKVERWLDDRSSQPIMTLFGPRGIGKSAVAAHAVRRWKARHPSSDAFVWCFQRDPTTHEAFRALADYILDYSRPSKVGNQEAIDRALSLPVDRLVVFDGMDAIGLDSDALGQAFATAERVSDRGHNRVLLTTSAPFENRTRRVPELVIVNPLTQQDGEQLARRRLREAGVEAGDTATFVLNLITTLGATGNPLMVEWVVQWAVRLTPQEFLDEFDTSSVRSAIASGKVEELTDGAERVARAIDLLQRARTLLDRGDAEQAARVLDEAVALRDQLPSRRRKAEVHLTRGDANGRLGRDGAAQRDLHDALNGYRSLSDHIGIMITLQKFAEVHRQQKRLEMAVPMLTEALAISRQLARSLEMSVILLDLGTLYFELDRPHVAFEHFEEASRIDGAPGIRGRAHLWAARAAMQTGEPAIALTRAHEAAMQLEVESDTRQLAQALTLIAELEEAAGHYAEARQALERARSLRQSTRVYLSSTLTDLEAEREAVKEALAGEATIVHSYAGASTDLQADALQEVGKCDVYILILGMRYGFIPAGHTKSIIHLEYDIATARSIPRLVFVKDPAAIPMTSTDAISGDHPAEQIGQFRELVSAQVAAAHFATTDELKMHVRRSLEAFRRQSDPASVPDLDDRLRRLQTLEKASTQQATPEAPQRDVLEGDDRVISVEFKVHGRVAGVGFRVFGQKQMKELGLEGGIVENLPDGQIRVRARGPRSRLKELRERLRKGPPSARVEKVDTAIVEGGADSIENTTRAVIAIGVTRPAHVPPLPAAADAARAIAGWATSQHIPDDRVTLLTDEERLVTIERISDAFATFNASGVRQLIVYFAGYSVERDRSQYWQLSKESEDSDGRALDVHATIAHAHAAQIPHIVFISDTIAVPADSPVQHRYRSAHISAGSHQPISEPVAIDRIFARTSGPPTTALVFTTTLVSALSGSEPSIVEERDGRKVVRPTALTRYLEEATRKQGQALGVSVAISEAVIESGPEAWLSRMV